MQTDTTRLSTRFSFQLCLVTLFVGVSMWVTNSTLGAAPNFITFTMPADGWATIAINDAQGKRVRNLFGDVPFKAGVHSVEWDGRDDASELMPAGTYQWTGLHRDDIAAVYRGSFQHGSPPWLYGRTGGWTGDHAAATTVVAWRDRILLGTNEAEWGHGLISADLDGRKQWGVKWLDKRAWCGAESLAVAGGRVFTSSYLGETAVWEINPLSGGNKLAFERGDLPENLVGDRKPALRVVGGNKRGEVSELYVCDVTSSEPRTLVLRVGKPGEPLNFDRTLPIRTWSLAWLSDGRCVAAVDNAVVLLDTQTGTTTPFVTSPISAPWGLAVDGKDRIYVSDQGATGMHQYTRQGQLSHRFLRLETPASHQVKVFDASGKLLRAMGREGGQQVGEIDPESFFQPAGLAVDQRGRLWVTEFTQSPKRVSVWEMPDDLAATKPTLVHQFFGPAHYGGGAAMIDPTKPWEIMDTNFGVIFDVNLETGEHRAARLPWRHLDAWKEHGRRDGMPFAGRPGVIIPVDGRSFTAAQGGYMHGDDARWTPHRFTSNGPTMIGEYIHGLFVPRAAIGNIRMWMRNRELNTRREEQWLPKAILDAAKALPNWPELAAGMGMGVDGSDVPHVEHKRGSPDWIVHPWPQAISGFLWVDANGNQTMEANEVSFHAMGDSGVVTLDPQLNIYWQVDAWHKNEFVGTWKLTRQGFNKAGAPAYDWANLKKISEQPQTPAQVGTDGSMLEWTSLRDADGNLRWSYPYNAKGVKALGKDSRDTMKPGSIHRVNALQGVVKGPGDLGEVYLLHSNDGMDYLMTRQDGLFIAMIFRPYAFSDGWDSLVQAEPGLRLDRHSLQDECFNAHFVRSEADGKGFRKGAYYLLGNSRSAVVEITGLDTVNRFAGGSVPLVEGAGRYGKGQRYDPAQLVPQPQARRTVEPLTASPQAAGKDLFRGKSGTFANTEVWAGWTKDGLHLKWQVKSDDTPFVNQGSDWTQAFATGDGVELQLKSPTMGRLRIIAAMVADKPTLIRIRYDGQPTDTAVTWRSDVATTSASSVTRIGSDYSVRRFDKNGYVVQFAIPWKELGIESPKAGMELPIELGVMFSDKGGSKTQNREFWISGSGMVADLPTEARPSDKFGKLILGE